MRPRGFSSATRLAGRSWRTIWQKTFCSRTRRAISWPYCEPKSKIRMRSFSEKGFMMLTHFLGSRFGRVCRILGEQFFQHRFVVNLAVAAEALDLDLDVHLIVVIDEFDFPAFPGNIHLNHERILTMLL